jgi:hypothetical protein
MRALEKELERRNLWTIRLPIGTLAYIHREVQGLPERMRLRRQREKRKRKYS